MHSLEYVFKFFGALLELEQLGSIDLSLHGFPNGKPNVQAVPSR